MATNRLVSMITTRQRLIEVRAQHPAPKGPVARALARLELYFQGCGNMLGQRGMAGLGVRVCIST